MNTEKKEKAKKVLLNRKIMLGVSAIVVCMVLIGVCSFMPFIIDPTRWQTNEFLTDELITIAIVISSMVGAVFVGQASNAQDERSNLSKARNAFFITITKVNENVNRFEQWVKKVLQVQDANTIRLRELKEVGIEDITLLDLEYAEIKALLETPQKYNGRYYKGLSKEQIKVLLKVKGHKKKNKFVEPGYYLSVKNIIDNRTISERSANESAKKGLFVIRNFVGKIIITVASGLIFASLMRDLTSDMNQGEAWVKFLSRLWSMASSIFMGYLTGCQINDIDAEYVEMRTEVHRKYLQDTSFVAKSQQEEARDEFIQRVKKEQVNPALAESNGHDTKLPVIIDKGE